MKEVFDSIIDKLEDLHAEYINQYGVVGSNPRASAVSRCIRTVEEVQEEYNGGWIPCSERLPEKGADVLLSLRSLDVYTGFMANTEGCFYVEGEGYVELENVLAWQPLPAPYRLENDDV